MDRIRRIKDLIRHKRAFWKMEKQLLGKHTIRGITHDLDKLIMFLLPLPTSFVRRFHKQIAKHHNTKTYFDRLEKIVDYECARYTKRNSKYTAREYIEHTYCGKELEVYQHILDSLGL